MRGAPPELMQLNKMLANSCVWRSCWLHLKFHLLQRLKTCCEHSNHESNGSHQPCCPCVPIKSVPHVHARVHGRMAFIKRVLKLHEGYNRYHKSLGAEDHHLHVCLAIPILDRKGRCAKAAPCTCVRNFQSTEMGKSLTFWTLQN